MLNYILDTFAMLISSYSDNVVGQIKFSNNYIQLITFQVFNFYLEVSSFSQFSSWSLSVPWEKHIKVSGCMS